MEDAAQEKRQVLDALRGDEVAYYADCNDGDTDKVENREWKRCRCLYLKKSQCNDFFQGQKETSPKKSDYDMG